MSGFDIHSPVEFKPAKYFCPKCYALLTEAPYSYEARIAKCPVCGLVFLPTEENPYYGVGGYLKQQGYAIEFSNLVDHARALAQSADLMSPVRGPDGILGKGPPPIRVLFQSFLHAERFIHFASYGISQMLLGAVKLISQRIPVRGIVTNMEKGMIEELTQYSDEAPRLHLRVFERKDQMENWSSTPHQKFIIVDGLLAFKGSANLTVSGWRKAAQGLDIYVSITRGARDPKSGRIVGDGIRLRPFQLDGSNRQLDHWLS